ncbi:MAG TPA: hypothetical protein DD412_00610 [Holosporales bacterium]|nr:hypothetical protein [Holosporales bacterium]
MKQLKLQCDVLILSCIDYRFPHLICDYLDARGLIGNYDIFTLPGASLGACCPEYPHWNETFEEVVTLAMGLHSIKKIIILNHEECGAFQKLRGVPKKKSDEIMMHKNQVAITQAWLEKKFPQLDYEFLYINLSGDVVAL